MADINASGEFIAGVASNASAAMTSLEWFSIHFKYPGGGMAVIIALVGIILNILNIIILLHPKMRNPVNLLLTMSACCQLCLLVIFIPFLSIYSLSYKPGQITHHSTSIHHSKYFLFFADASLFFHMSSSWLIITTACFRFIFVQFPLKSAAMCTFRRAILAGVLCILGVLGLQIPNIMVNEIVELECEKATHGDLCEDGERIYTMYGDPDGKKKGLVIANLWLLAVFGKFLPSIMLLVFTIFLINVLREAAKRKQRLHAGSRHAKTVDSEKNEHSQTTRMLLAVVVLFLVVEFPHGILLAYITGSGSWVLYNQLGDVIDLVTITAFSVNLILYSTMSRQYRTLFIQLIGKKIAAILPCKKKKLRPRTHSNVSYMAHSNGPQTFVTESCALSVTMDTHVAPVQDADKEKERLVHHHLLDAN